MNAEPDMSMEDRIDWIVAEYADRIARDEDPRREELLAREPQLRAELERCFRMIEAGIGADSSPPIALGHDSKLAGFRILRELGRGGMAVVYLAQQTGLQRQVALKVMRSHLTLDERQIQRFQREARAVARLKHPNVVPIHAVGEDDGHHYIALEYVDGGNLEQVLEQMRALDRRPEAADLARACGSEELARAQSYSEAVTLLFEGILAGVAAAHETGIVHRDLKPSNILLDSAGVPLLADFGLAKGPGDLGVSITGEVLGTPYYMSPEQAHATVDAIDARTDIYSLGVMLYELLTLRRPVSGKTYHEILSAILSGQPQAPRTLAADVSESIESVVMKALEKEPARRYAGAKELSEDLARARAGLAVEASGRGGLPVAYYSLWAAMTERRPYEYRSPGTVFGLPWLHIVSGVVDARTRAPKVAKGVFAFGNVAIGIIAGGGFAAGLFAIGGIGLGVVSLAGVALGFTPIGGVALGYKAQGLYAFGYYADGLLATHAIQPGFPEPSPDSAPPDLLLGAVVSTTLIWLFNAGLARRAARTSHQRRVILRTELVLVPVLLVVPPLLASVLGMPEWGLLAVYLALTGAITRFTTRWVRRVAPELLPFHTLRNR